jgi:ABC-type phosphate transport system substrate-binding protein
MKKLFLASLMVAASSLFAVRAQAQVVVIVNPSVKASDVSKADLKEVFSGMASELADGSHVVPVLLKQGPAHEAFLTDYVGKSDAALGATWRSLVFSGQRSMPKSVDSDAAMVEYVAHTPGAIGYIGKASPHDGVKVLAVR